MLTAAVERHPDLIDGPMSWAKAPAFEEEDQVTRQQDGPREAATSEALDHRKVSSHDRLDP